MTTKIDITPARLRCGSGFCPTVIYTPADLRCDVVASCSEVTGKDGVLTIVGKQVEHPKAGPGEAAVEIGEEYFSDLPEVVRLRERVASLEVALNPFAMASDGYEDGNWDNFDAVQGYAAANEITIGDLLRAAKALSQGKETT